ncbi:hypothetical protein CISG_05803 [Coccidioides immitis RMSCC 3703]|uniref:Uncharacterized protein n=1 Tax=Coccidioides immitis RMSCC 3703 TaxID=454286 RepID=A0A0J8QXB0_COCIT|nr:hypothetical protein CISG_05803 [Coccidioides immitis RMSCC 3703]
MESKGPLTGTEDLWRYSLAWVVVVGSRTCISESAKDQSGLESDPTNVDLDNSSPSPSSAAHPYNITRRHEIPPQRTVFPYRGVLSPLSLTIKRNLSSTLLDHAVSRPLLSSLDLPPVAYARRIPLPTSFLRVQTRIIRCPPPIS